MRWSKAMDGWGMIEGGKQERRGEKGTTFVGKVKMHEQKRLDDSGRLRCPRKEIAGMTSPMRNLNCFLRWLVFYLSN